MKEVKFKANKKDLEAIREQIPALDTTDATAGQVLTVETPGEPAVWGDGVNDLKSAINELTININNSDISWVTGGLGSYGENYNRATSIRTKQFIPTDMLDYLIPNEGYTEGNICFYTDASGARQSFLGRVWFENPTVYYIKGAVEKTYTSAQYIRVEIANVDGDVSKYAYCSITAFITKDVQKIYNELHKFYTISKFEWAQGSITGTGAENNSPYRIRTNYQKTAEIAGAFITLESGYKAELDYFDKIGGSITFSTGWTTNKTDIDPTKGKYVRIVLAVDTTGNVEIHPSDYYNLIFYNSSAFKPFYESLTELLPLKTKTLRHIREIQTNTDLNTLYENGWYTTTYSGNYPNSPEGNGSIGQRIIVVMSGYDNPNSTSWRGMLYYNFYTGCFAFRIYHGGNWDGWNVINAKYYTDNMLETFQPASLSAQGENDGVNISVMSYNIFTYQCTTGSKTGLPNDKMLNLRRFLGKNNCDIICLQEHREYVDTVNSKLASEYVFNPVYPYSYSENYKMNTIFSKKEATSHGKVKLSTYGGDARSIEYCCFTIGNKILLVMDTHPTWNDSGQGGESAASIAARLSNYQDIFNWENGTAQLYNMTGTELISVPAHTHCIICMDGNSVTADDKTNLDTIAADNDFILGNGGRFGWFYTCDIGLASVCSLDNIIVSDNIIINNIDALSGAYNELYSDHVPVIANLTLLGN